MTAESDIAAIDDGGANTASEVRTALTSVLARADDTDIPVYSDAGMSDEFTAGTLDGQWSVVGGTSGTVNLITADPTDSVYDLTTRSGSCLVQIKPADSIAFRVDDVITTGEQILVKMGMVAPGDNPSDANSYWTGIGFNNNDSDYDAGTHIEMFWDGADVSRIVWGAAGASGDISHGIVTGTYIYWRAVNSGGTVYAFYSYNAKLWVPIGTGISIGSADNFWVFFDSKGVSYTHAPIASIEWVRHIANTNLDPY